MPGKALITYSSKHGSTAEIAERIRSVVNESGIACEVKPVNEITQVTDYSAIILGSAVYIGQWRKDAVRFLKKNEKVLSEVPLWVFSSGPTGEGNPVELMKGWKLPANLKSIVERVKPKGIDVFHGSLELSGMSFFEKWIIKKVKAPIGDFRDWNAIEGWAKNIADELNSKNG